MAPSSGASPTASLTVRPLLRTLAPLPLSPRPPDCRPPTPTASYTDPTTGRLVHLPANEAGRATLHGGIAGYARSGWRILERSHDRLVFSLVDHAAEGFPGTLDVRAAYTLRSDPVRLATHLEARVHPSPGGGGQGEGETSPIMLSSHVYWNLDGFQAPEQGRGTGGSARDHRLWVDADRFLETDSELVRPPFALDSFGAAVLSSCEPRC